MIIRLATCENADDEVPDVIEALNEDRDYVYWGSGRAQPCDYLFIHSKGDSTIRSILKVRTTKARTEISEGDFLSHRPKSWAAEMEWKTYFVIEAAKMVSIQRHNLRDGDGNELKTMYDNNFVTSDKFVPF